MTFASLQFVFFFVFITFAYYLLPSRFRWVLLLLGSCYFYMAFVPKYILILFALIIVDFIAGIQIENSTGVKKKIFFITSLVSNIGMLFIFKYFNFFNDNIRTFASLVHWNYSLHSLTLLLPLGLSFHTFQSLSYIIEVYRGKYKAERHIGIYALYVLFFPQLVAGPIERPQHLLPQLKKEVTFDWSVIFSGLRLLGWGFFKKLVIADRLAVSVNYIYGHINGVSGLSILTAIIFFAFQLYTDFSGYSDIARGSARVLGIDVMKNFEQPYFSKSVAEFWRRWHISLSTWFRDYFYFPLVSSYKRITKFWLYACVIMTFLVTGLWHGAGWTFIIMGLLHGLYITVGSLTQRWRDKIWETLPNALTEKLRNIFQTIFTFSLVSFSWIFFRSTNLTTALIFVRRLFLGWNISLQFIINNYFIKPTATLGLSHSDLLISLGSIIFLLGIEELQNRKIAFSLLNTQPVLVRSFLYSGLLLAIFIFGVYETKQFIYFQF